MPIIPVAIAFTLNSIGVGTFVWAWTKAQCQTSEREKLEFVYNCYKNGKLDDLFNIAEQ